MPKPRPPHGVVAALLVAVLAALLYWLHGVHPEAPAGQSSDTSGEAPSPARDSIPGVSDAQANSPDRRELDLLTVSVRNDRGAAVGGAIVEVGGRAIRTDPDGRCGIALEGLSRGHLLLVTHDRYKATLAELVPGDFQTKRKEVVLLLTIAIDGTVSDHVGTPVRDADVAVYDGRRPDLPDEAVLGHAKTGTDGVYRIELPQAGPVFVVVKKRGFVAANEVDAGTLSGVIGTTVLGTKKLDVRLFPVLVSVVGIVNRSPMPDEQVRHYCAFARDVAPSLAELAPTMHSVEDEARAMVVDVAKQYAHVSAWIGRPVIGKPSPSVMPVRVEAVDGTWALVQARLVRLADMTTADIASHDFAVGVPMGALELAVEYPTTVAMLKDGRATMWQRSVEPAAGTVRLVVPAGRYVVTPSPNTLLRTEGRRTEVEVTAGTVVHLPNGGAARADVAVLRVVVVDKTGPVDMKSLNLQIRSSGGRLSLRGLTEPELRIYAEPGDCEVLVRDATGLHRGRLRFVASAGMTEPVVVSIAR